MGRYYQRKTQGVRPPDAVGVVYDWTDETQRDETMYGWRLYLRAASVDPWLSLKLVRMTAGRGPANYWLGWNVESKRFNRSRSTLAIPEAMRAELAGVLSIDSTPAFWDRADAAACMASLEGDAGELSALMQ